MAKKAKKQNKKATEKQIPENMLPQNILPVGERVEENKNIYISQTVYKQIHKFTQNKTTNESGGMLVGTVVEEFGKTNILISGFVEAKFCEATPTTLKFTHETWEYVHKEIEKKHKGQKIVGWIHTHPDFGIFLSEYDKFIHQNFFSEAHQIAYVVDPIQNIEGFYFWINGNIERCKGFYIYDKTGTRINVDFAKEEENTESSSRSGSAVKSVLIAILFVAVALLTFFNISLSKQCQQLENRVVMLESQQLSIVESANLALYQMQQAIATQTQEIQTLKAALGMIGADVPEDPEETPTEDPTENPEQDAQTGETPTEDPTENSEQDAQTGETPVTDEDEGVTSDE